jgi:hypothetical protein
MRRRVILTIMTSICASPLQGQLDIVSFYPTVAAEADHPPPLKSLVVLCEQQLEWRERRGRLTFVGHPDGTALLVVIDAKVGIPEKTISLTPIGGEFPPRRLTPPHSAWGYIWDRNGDARVDYLALLSEPLFVLPDSVPVEFPTVIQAPESSELDDATYYFGWADRPPSREPGQRSGRFSRTVKGPAGTVAIDRDALPILMDRLRVVFRHYDDDNFDGRLEAIILAEPEFDWDLIVRSTVFYRASGWGLVDSVWSYRNAITDSVSAERPLGRDYYHSPLSLQRMPVSTFFDQGEGFMELINLGVSKCGGRIRLRRE